MKRLQITLLLGFLLRPSISSTMSTYTTKAGAAGCKMPWYVWALLASLPVSREAKSACQSHFTGKRNSNTPKLYLCIRAAILSGEAKTGKSRYVLPSWLFQPELKTM